MRKELRTEDFGLDKSLEIAGILYVFPNYQTAWIRQKIGSSAEAELFRASLSFFTLFYFFIPLCNVLEFLLLFRQIFFTVLIITVFGFQFSV